MTSKILKLINFVCSYWREHCNEKYVLAKTFNKLCYCKLEVRYWQFDAEQTDPFYLALWLQPSQVWTGLYKVTRTGFASILLPKGSNYPGINNWAHFNLLFPKIENGNCKLQITV